MNRSRAISDELVKCSIRCRGEGNFDLIQNNQVIYSATIHRTTNCSVLVITSLDNRVIAKMIGTTDGSSYALTHRNDKLTIEYYATYGQTPRRMHITLGDIELHNKQPMWMATLQAFCLNFEGRVQVASVKNFILSWHGQDNVMIFGRTQDRHIFVMEYAPPLSAVFAFAIALSSLDSKSTTVC